jgi:hypothetical protein
VLADKAYDADRIRELIQDQGATPNIPPKSNRRWKPCFSKRLYRERNLIERFFSKLKHFRRVATRYDKLAANFLAMNQLTSMRLWLRTHESTAQSPVQHLRARLCGSRVVNSFSRCGLKLPLDRRRRGASTSLSPSGRCRRPAGRGAIRSWRIGVR